MDVFEIIKDLINADAPAGFEKPAAEIAAKLVKPYVDEINIDTLGNLIACRKCGKPNAQRVLLDAHIDEIGLIITGADGEFLRFSSLGGSDPRVLPASVVKILTEPPVYGVIDVKPPHVLSNADTDKTLKIDELRIDAGGVEIQVGTPAVVVSDAVRLGEFRISGKALDNRAGFAAIILALDMLGGAELDFDVYILASAQEETGTRGVKTGVSQILPDIALIVDMDYGSQPNMDSAKTKKLGSGATIAYGPNMNRELTRKLISIAEKNEIAHTVCVEPGDSGTNAREIQIAGTGVATALLGVPLRYMHTPVETVDIRDITALAEIIAAFLRGGDANA